jgi:hypothetical protein
MLTATAVIYHEKNFYSLYVYSKESNTILLHQDFCQFSDAKKYRENLRY